MAVDTFSPSLRIRLQGDGNNPQTWGQIANTDFDLFEDAITGDNGYAGGGGGINIGGLATYTLTVANGTVDQARQLLYPFVGALTAPCTVTLPGVVKIGWATNATTGGQDIVLSVGSGTTLTIPPTTGWTLFYCDGGNVSAPPLSLLGGVGDTTVAGNLTITGTTTVLGPIQMNNATALRSKNFAGTSQNILFVDTANNTDLVSAGTGVRFLNQAQTIALLTVTDSGAVTVPGSISGGSASIGGVSMSGGTLNANVVNGGSSGTIGGVTMTGGSTTMVGTVTAAVVNGTAGGTIGGVSMNTGLLSATVVNGTSGGTIGGVTLNNNNVSVPGTVFTSLLVVSGGQTQSGAGTFILGTGAQTTPLAWTFSIGANFTNGAAAAGFLTVSDERLKSQIEDITPEDGVSWVKRGRPRTYMLDNRPSAGFVAQEDIAAGRWQAVVALPDDRPMFATGDGVVPAGQRLSRDYNHDIPYLTAALQAALAKVETLSAQVERLEADWRGWRRAR